MTVEVVIPWRSGCEHRARALNWVLDRYQAQHPDWDVSLALSPAGPWVKAWAVMPAIGFSRADIVVVADADVWCDHLTDAVDAVRDGAAWAIPHWLVKRLDQIGTDRLLAGQDPAGRYDQKPYPGMPGGGIVVAPRAVLLDIPMDPRFVGWGQEDESHAAALQSLLGPPWRGTADLIHLWHPPQPRASRARGNQDGWRLRRRYLKARHDPNQMRELLEEAHRDLGTPQPALQHPESRRLH